MLHFLLIDCFFLLLVHGLVGSSMMRRSRTEQDCNRDKEQTVYDIDFSEKI